MWHVPIVAKTRLVAGVCALASGLALAGNSAVSRADCIDYATDPPYPLIGSLEIVNRVMGDLVIVGSYAYLTTFAPVTFPGGEIYVVDISDAADPETLGFTGGGGYHGEIASNGSHAYVFAENQTERTIRVYDVDPPNVPTGVTAVSTNGRDMALAGDLLYVASHVGLEIMNVSNPANPVTIGTLSTSIADPYIVVSGAYAYVARTQSTGRFLVVNVSDPTAPTIAGEYSDSIDGFDALAVHGDIAVVRSGTELLAIDVSDPSAPTVIGQITVPGAGELAFDSSGTLYTYGEELTVLDFSDPTQPELIGSTTPPNFYGRLAVTDSHVFVYHVNWTNYRLQLDLLPVQCPVAQDVENAPAAVIVALETPRPNPFRGQTAIHYELTAADHVNLRILDVQGRLVRRLEDDAWKLQGSHQAVWNGRDDRGREVAPGMYYAWIRLTGPDGSGYSASRGLTLLE